MGSPSHPKCNKTSFIRGMERSKESIERQRATVAAARLAGTWSGGWPKGSKHSTSTLVKRAATRRARSIGHTVLKKSRNLVYRMIMTPDGYRYEHRVVAAKTLGRPLLRTEHVHHLDHDTLNNAPANLQVLRNGEHTVLHLTGVYPAAAVAAVRLNGRWAREFPACIDCGTSERPHLTLGRCGRCASKHWRLTHRVRYRELKAASYRRLEDADPEGRRAARKAARYHHCPKT